MRLALPLIYCVPDDVKAKLLGKITDLDSVPKLWWGEWLSSEAREDIDYYEKMKRIDRFMRQAPSRSRG